MNDHISNISRRNDVFENRRCEDISGKYQYYTKLSIHMFVSQRSFIQKKKHCVINIIYRFIEYVLFVEILEVILNERHTLGLHAT